MAVLLSDAQATSLGSEKYRINGVKGPYLRKSSDGAGLFHNKLHRKPATSVVGRNVKGTFFDNFGEIRCIIES